MAGSVISLDVGVREEEGKKDSKTLVQADGLKAYNQKREYRSSPAP